MSWFRLTQSVLARGHRPFCALYCHVLDYILICPSQNISYPAPFLFRNMFEYSGHICIFSIWQFSSNTAFSTLLATEATHYCLSGYVIFGQDYLLCQWIYTTLLAVPCHSEQHVECFPLSKSFISFYLSLPTQHQLQRLSQWQQIPVPCKFLFLVWSSLSLLHPGTGSYFQGSWFPWSCSGAWSSSVYKMHIALQELQAVALELHKRPFSYLVRWLPYIWIIVMLSLLYVIKVV